MITISVDDGHPLDWKTAELLEKYNLSATFYWSKSNPKHRVMSEEEMLAFRDRFPQMEIGQHTYSHPLLTQVPNWKEEIDQGKEWHEQLFGETPRIFCPPRGYQNDEIVEYLKELGYVGSRLVQEKRRDAFNFGTTHLYNGQWVNRGNTDSLFFHSWEVDKFNDWDILEETLKKLKDVILNSEYACLHS